ncbi:MAG: hypothetical protein AAGC55_34740, partial [Myxococcota bacterium]
MATRTLVDDPDRAYGGAVGRTRTEQVHFTCPCGRSVTVEVYRSIDASAHPELARRLLGVGAD